ncbi:CLUMA_CG012326, isoform A [Clunio marinus]|uniref:CLUMA_CG012326, isoform A n=1 Tax=Clunio marinus TaxID=568069 RepID=A0A1J1IJQ5_9DIPT|nr:CLUMA_CG012326, isoform A [Clunio marinus]
MRTKKYIKLIPKTVKYQTRLPNIMLYGYSLQMEKQKIVFMLINVPAVTNIHHSEEKNVKLEIHV